MAPCRASRLVQRRSAVCRHPFIKNNNTSLNDVRELLEEVTTSKIDFKDNEIKLKEKVKTCDIWIKDMLENVDGVKGEEGEGGDEELTTLMKFIRAGYANPEKRQTLKKFLASGKSLPCIVEHHTVLSGEAYAYQWVEDAKEALASKPLLSTLKTILSALQDVRENLPLTEEGRKNWAVDVEEEVKALVQKTDAWLEIFKSFKVHVYNIKSKQRRWLSL